VLLDDAGVCASAGSACASGALGRAMLLAMGVDERDARTGVRFSLGWASDEADVAPPGGGRARRGATEGAA